MLSAPVAPGESTQGLLLALLPSGSDQLRIFYIKFALNLLLLLGWIRLIAQDLLEVDAAMLLLKLRLSPI
jgi:hypothetical protein